MVYNIKKLECKYKNSENPVLLVDDLQIKSGEVVFFLGASGVGKSTILETLGLMNNTIYSTKESVFTFKMGVENKNMLDIWEETESQLAKFRNKHLSFIFQSTNLFSNLNALDNVLLTPLLQKTSEIEARNLLRPIFKDIFPVKYNEILNNKKITEMSGGQRQRLSFVRSIASDYNVLLADEPTGNLDWANANNLMNYLIKDIRDKKSTAIIVSHDISLAIEHADKIVFMDKQYDKEKNYHYGVISKANTYIKDDSEAKIKTKKVESSNWFNLIDYGGSKPPFIAGFDLTDFFKEQISKQNNSNV